MYRMNKLILLLLSIMPVNVRCNFHCSQRENWNAISIRATATEELQPWSESDLLTWFNSRTQRQMGHVFLLVLFGLGGTMWLWARGLRKERFTNVYDKKTKTILYGDASVAYLGKTLCSCCLQMWKSEREVEVVEMSKCLLRFKATLQNIPGLGNGGNDG